MSISAKKKKYIKRNYKRFSVPDIAGELRIKTSDVKKVIQEIEAGDAETYRKIKLIKGANKVVGYGVYVLVACSPLIFIKGIHQFSALPQTAFIEVFIAFLFFLWTLRINFEKTVIFKNTPLQLPLLLYFILVTSSLFWAVNPFESITYIFHLFICILLFLIVKENMNSRERLWGIFVASIGGGVLTSLIGIAQYFTGFDWIPQVSRPSATFGNKNFAAQYIIMVIPLSIAVWGMNKSFFEKAISMVAFLVMVFYLLLTKTRGAWMGFCGSLVLGLVVVFFIKGRSFYKEFFRERKNAVCAIFVILATTIIIFFFNFSQTRVMETIKSDLNPVQTIKTILETDKGTAKNRLVTWKNTWEMTKDHFFFGVGIENFKVYYPRYFREIEPSLNVFLSQTIKRAHNDYMEILAELGIFGLILYLWIMVTFFYLSWHALRKSDDKDSTFLALGIAAGLFAFLIDSFFSFPNKKPVPMLFCFLFLAITSTLYDQARNLHPLTNGPEKKGLRYFAKLAMIGSLFFLIFIIIWNARFIMADYHFYRYMGYSKQEKPDLAYGEAKKMMDAYPYFYKYWITWGGANSKSGKYDEAIQINDKALKYDPYRFQLLYNQGGNYMQKGQYRKAADQYNRLLAMNPDIAEAHRALGMIYSYYLVDREKALYHFKEVLRIDPKIEDAEAIQSMIDNDPKIEHP